MFPGVTHVVSQHSNLTAWGDDVVCTEILQFRENWSNINNIAGGNEQCLPGRLNI